MCQKQPETRMIFLRREDEVGGSGEGFDVEAEAEAEGVDEASERLNLAYEPLKGAKVFIIISCGEYDWYLQNLQSRAESCGFSRDSTKFVSRHS
jgi:hypothetical protein